jgi:hypothetical protein
MENENHRPGQGGILLLVCAIVSIISLMLFPVTQSVKKVTAAPLNATPNNIMKINKSKLNNPASNKALMAPASKNPIYRANGWILSIKKLKSAGFPQQVELIFENGTMNGVGKVTNLETWIISPIGAHGFGNGIITAKDKQMVTWTAHDINGTNNKNGTETYWGDIFFNGANSTGKLAFLNNFQGSYITEANGNNQTTKIWKLK